MDENVSMVLSLLTGVALFLFGMSSMSDGLKKVAGNKMEMILYKLTNTPLKGFLLGTAVTCAVQSSSAATVMVIGFVNSGMMKFTQAIAVILGANIGTSITGWIVSLSYVEGAGWASYFSSTTITAVVAVAGMLLHMFAKKDVLKHTGSILLGFAVLMAGMSMMSGAVAPLRTNPVFIDTMVALNNPALAGLFGIAFAAILQSSSAAVGVIQALSTTGAITFQGAFPMVMGIGIGASFPVLLAAMGSSRAGQRTSLAYLVVSVLGMMLGALVYYPLEMLGVLHLNDLVMDPFTIAATNTLFRAITMTLMLPAVHGVRALIMLLMPVTEAEKEDQPDFEKLDSRLLQNPELAYQRAMEVMEGMALKAQKNVRRAIRLLEDYSDEGYRKVEHLEKTLNKYEDKLGKYLVAIMTMAISEDQSRSISKSLQAIGDFESIGDYALEIANLARSVNQKKENFSLEARDELAIMSAAVEESIDLTVEAFENDDVQSIRRVFPLRELVTVSADEIKKRHIRRLQEGKCSMEMGFIQSEMLVNMQRIVDHCANIALDMVKQAEQDFNVHRFLRKYQEQSRSEYADLLSQYETKYNINQVPHPQEEEEDRSPAEMPEGMVLQS